MNPWERFIKSLKSQFLHLTCSRLHRYYGMGPTGELGQPGSKAYMCNHYIALLPP